MNSSALLATVEYHISVAAASSVVTCTSTAWSKVPPIGVILGVLSGERGMMPTSRVAEPGRYSSLPANEAVTVTVVVVSTSAVLIFPLSSTWQMDLSDEV